MDILVSIGLQLSISSIQSKSFKERQHKEDECRLLVNYLIQ